MDFKDRAWNDPYTRCTAKNDSAALKQLHDTYLSTADRFITYYRAISKAVYGRDIPLILLMHVGAFDAHMLPELLNYTASEGIPLSPFHEPLPILSTPKTQTLHTRMATLSPSNYPSSVA